MPANWPRKSQLSLVLYQKMKDSFAAKFRTIRVRIKRFINHIATGLIGTLWQQEMLLSLLPASQLPCLLHSRAKAQNALLHCRKKADFHSDPADIHTISVDISSPLIRRHLLEAGNF